MSLTSHLSDPANFELREKLKTEFLRPPFKFEKKIKAVPKTKNYGIIGTAFDYLLRFAIQYHNKGKTITEETWIAEFAFNRLVRILSEEDRVRLVCRFIQAKKNYESFLKKGMCTDFLCKDCLFLAKLDLYIRSRIIAPDLFYEDLSDVIDLQNLYSALNIEDFKVKKFCFLNPHFERASVIVGGADADIILDDTLIEIKVTKELKLERDYLNQLIGYYVLALIGGINGIHQGTTIKKVGVYFARHGFLWTVPLDELGNAGKFNSFKSWFENYFAAKREKRRSKSNHPVAPSKNKNNGRKLRA